MPNVSTSKKITKSRRDLISVVIISPCLGYKIKFNKKAPMIYCGSQPAVSYHVEKIKENFNKNEIFLVAGEFYQNFRDIQDGFGLIENQLYSITGEIEQLRLGIQACTSRRILVLKERSIIDFDKIKKIENSIYVNDDESAPGCIINDSMLESISHGIDGDKFSGCFIITDKMVDKFYEYASKEYNKNKMLYEAINHFTDFGFKVIK